MKQVLSVCALAAAAWVCGQAAWAQEAGVTSKLTAARVATVDGKTVLGSAEQAKPGDAVEYRATYNNAGKSAAQGLQAVVPVPAGTVLMAETPQPAGAYASTDGVNFAAMPLKRTVKLASGALQEELVPLPDYRAVRWNVGTLPPGKEAAVSLRVRINPANPANPALAPSLAPSAK
jgi:uncharacterized repeat protein (TIGR01451 family)